MRIALLIVALSLPAHAFQIGTAFTTPCHERLTVSAFKQTLSTWPVEDMPQAAGRAEVGFSADFGKKFAPDLDPRYHYALFSLIVGVRSPDCEGHSLFELEHTRLIHVPADDQYGHALRNSTDDGEAGNQAAMNGTRAVILDLTAKGRTTDFITVKHFADNYGLLDVKVWAPAYFLGRAAHATQDAFSHTLRDNDFHTVRHVMNYADALIKEYEEDRDGLRHSGSMDQCDDAINAPIRAAAAQATAELMLARGSEAEVTAMMDSWLGINTGCDMANKYCDNPWLTFAASDQTHSYLGCSSGSGVLMLATLALFRRKKR
jgi:hypothetical protein